MIHSSAVSRNTLQSETHRIASTDVWDRTSAINELKKTSIAYEKWQESLRLRDSIMKQYGTDNNTFDKSRDLVQQWHAEWQNEMNSIQPEVDPEIEVMIEALNNELNEYRQLQPREETK